MILAIDTSTSVSSIALFDGEVRAEQTWLAEQSQTTQLLPEIQGTLALQSLELKDLKGLAVALGPGSFNGLRVGLSTAKMLALALRIPIVGIGTLEATAFAYVYARLPIRPVMDAGRGEVSTALFEMRDGAWRHEEEPWIGSVESICQRISRPTFLCGDVGKVFAVEMRRRLGTLVTAPVGAAAVRRAGYLAELGLKRIQARDFDDLATLQPAYLRGPAVTKSRRTDALAVHPQHHRGDQGA